MASNFPKLPGYVPTHDPTMVNHKKVSHVKLDKIRNANNTDVPLYAVPRPPVANFKAEKTDASKSFSQSVFVPHGGKDAQEQFEPTFVKLDKQVSKQSDSNALLTFCNSSLQKIYQHRTTVHVHSMHVSVCALASLFVRKLFIYYIGAEILRLFQGERR